MNGHLLFGARFPNHLVHNDLDLLKRRGKGMMRHAPVVHCLKTEGIYFDAIVRGEKTFEVRRNDRAFQCGDIVSLIRLDEDGLECKAFPILYRRIGWMLHGGQFGIEPGYVVFSLDPIDAPSDRDGG